ncbi:MAG: hypothetical protein P1Q69_11235 [Candidatus Thorarchaeota archaeon]|nr:hypothetical protein [Candidatus Thorarchaeota archaeon]
MGVISIRYDPLNGLSVRTPNDYQHILITHNQMEDHLGRTIKYVGIESERYSTYAEHDERIYSIRVSYSGSDYTIFHESCNEADSLYQDNSFATSFLKEDAEDGDIALWGVYDAEPADTISNEIVDGDRAILLQGGWQDTGYRYPYNVADYWNDASNFVIQWSMKYSEAYQVFVSLDTSAGHRYMWYTPASSDSLGTGEYVQYGLGSASYDGRWHTFQRDLLADLQQAQPSVTINDVNAFLIRGSGYVDDIKLLSYLSIKEDAEDGRTTGWDEYSGTGNVYNVLVDNKRVIQLSGSGTSTGYKYPYSTSWNDAKHLTIQWDMKYSENYRIYISVDTTAGHRYMTYDPVDVDNLGTGEYVFHGLGSSSKDGTWHTFTRDLLADLHDAQPTVDIIDVNAILIRGSGYIDNILLLPHSSEASLVVPSGQSYIQPSIISRPATNTWHGGTFVEALDRPFRLYQLSEFSVHGVVDQVASNRMGKTFVGLFDENMKCVFWIYMGDSWGGTTKGYFNTAYYPEDGGSYYQASGDLLTDFDKTGCLWYDRGTNSIKSTMTGKDATTLAEVDNPERVIMYLVVTAQAYDDYALLDMRIHDINIETNVRTAPPDMEEPPPGEDPLPTVYDGTDSGVSTNSAEQMHDDAANTANEHITSNWILINFWPVLEIIGSYVLDTGEAYLRAGGVDNHVQLRIDLLASVTIVSLGVGISNEDEILQHEAELSLLESFLIGYVVYSTLKAGLALICAVEQMGLSVYQPSTMIALGAGVALVALATVLAIAHVTMGLESGKLTHFAAMLFFAGLALSMASILAFGSLKGYLSTGLLYIFMKIWGYGDLAWNAVYSFLGQFMKWTKLIVIFMFILFCVLTASQLIMWWMYEF